MNDDFKLLEITLDNLPPTVNHYYRSTRGGRRYKTEAGRVYQEATVLQMTAAKRRGVEYPYTGRAGVYITLTAGSARKWDLDNRVKAVQDCLQIAGILADDSQIDELWVRREQSPIRRDSTRIVVTTKGAAI